MKIKTADAIEADLFSDPKLVVIAIAAMQTAIPAPLIMNNARRPSRSTAKKAMKQHRHFQVKADAARILERLELMPRFSLKMVEA
jgi:hypothetical protein